MSRNPDFSQFLKVLKRQGKPAYLTAYEHVASSGFISRRTGKPFDKMSPNTREYWQTYVDFWMSFGFDCVPIEVAPNLPLPEADHASGGHASESRVVIRTRDDFHRYPWPTEDDLLPFSHFEMAADAMPEGAKLVAGVCMGPFEWASNMLGVLGMSYLLLDDPELVGMVFERLRQIHTAIDRKLAAFEFVGALRQGDDLGFRTSTFLAPEDLRKYVFPTYRDLASIAHAAGKPFILHSCGQLAQVYDDIIDCGVDAKHSFEEAICPVEDFQRQYGQRITPLGGLDVDMICRATPDELRRYTRQKVEACCAAGYWAIGTGNSLTDYMPVENYLLVLEEARAITNAA